MEFGRLETSHALLLSPMERALLSPQAQPHHSLFKVTLHKYILSKFQPTPAMLLLQRILLLPIHVYFSFDLPLKDS